MAESSWSEGAFQARLESRANELGQPLPRLLANIGLGHDTLRRNVGARRLDTLERIAGALGWGLADVMGFSSRIDQRLSLEALQSARRVVNRLPSTARNDETLMWAHGCLYDLRTALEREGRLSSDEAARAATLANYEDAIVAAWEGRVVATAPSTAPSR